MSTPESLLCSNNCFKSHKSCPLIKIPGLFPAPIFTFVISGVPNADVLASSNNAITLTPYSPVFIVKATNCSAFKLSSIVPKRASSIKANISSLVFPKLKACSA